MQAHTRHPNSAVCTTYSYQLRDNFKHTTEVSAAVNPSPREGLGSSARPGRHGASRRARRRWSWTPERERRCTWSPPSGERSVSHDKPNARVAMEGRLGDGERVGGGGGGPARAAPSAAPGRACRRSWPPASVTVPGLLAGQHPLRAVQPSATTTTRRQGRPRSKLCPP